MSLEKFFKLQAVICIKSDPSRDLIEGDIYYIKAMVTIELDMYYFTSKDKDFKISYRSKPMFINSDNFETLENYRNKRLNVILNK